jgi:hypothetical protein
MEELSKISDRELLTRMPSLVLAERKCVADVIEHLVEIDRRRLYADQACGSLTSYCIERLGYSEDEAAKRVRVARLTQQFPEILDELRCGNIHVSGLCAMAPYLSPENCVGLLAGAREKSRRQIEELIARRFPKPPVPDRIGCIPEQGALAIRPGADQPAQTPDGSRKTAQASRACGGTEGRTASAAAYFRRSFVGLRGGS